MTTKSLKQEPIIVTAGSNYLDIDAYACCVALRELLVLKGENAVAYSHAKGNYSVCKSLWEEGQILNALPDGFSPEASRYLIVDVSDPEYLKVRRYVYAFAGIGRNVSGNYFDTQ